MILESTLSRPSCTISTLLLKNSHSSNKSLQKCKQNSFKIQEYSVILKSHSITFSMNVNVVSQMNWLSTCIAESILQTELSSAIRAMLKKCTSLDKVLLKFLTMKMTIPRLKKIIRWKPNQFFIFQNIVTLVTIKSCSISSPTSSSKPWTTSQTKRTEILVSKITTFQISFSCVLRKTCFWNYVICSHRQLRILRDAHWKEERDSCNRKTPVRRDMMIRLGNNRMIQVMKPILIWLLTNSRMFARKMHLMSSIQTKNQRARQVKKKIWNTIWTSSMEESMFWLKHWKKLMAWSQSKLTNRQ